jgi:hypothetical protein
MMSHAGGMEPCVIRCAVAPHIWAFNQFWRRLPFKPSGILGIMAEVRDDSCEVRIRREWTCVTIDDALRLDANKVMRCPACHGRVKAFHASTNGMRAHFEHYVAHPGCPRGDLFSGASSPHPEPL